jgi:hypothetical protein
VSGGFLREARSSRSAGDEPHSLKTEYEGVGGARLDPVGRERGRGKIP